MYFTEIDGDLQKGDLIKIHKGIAIGNFMLKQNTFAVYLYEHQEYYVKVLIDGKIKIISKILISAV